MNSPFIRKEVRSRASGGESTTVTLQVEIATGKAGLVIEKSIREYYPVQEMDAVLELYEDLNRSGVQSYTLADLAK